MTAHQHVFCTLLIFLFLQHYLDLFNNQPHAKTLLQARRLHFQAYFLYLKGQHNKAKLRLDLSLASSKNGEMSYDYEWAATSKRSWFGASDDIEMEMQTMGQDLIKFTFPAVG